MLLSHSVMKTNAATLVSLSRKCNDAMTHAVVADDTRNAIYDVAMWDDGSLYVARRVLGRRPVYLHSSYRHEAVKSPVARRVLAAVLASV